MKGALKGMVAKGGGKGKSKGVAASAALPTMSKKNAPRGNDEKSEASALPNMAVGNSLSEI